MPTSDANPSNDCPSTAVIHRPFGGVLGYRRISDRATRAVVHAFPMSELPRLAAAGLLNTPGAYVMTDGRIAYIGESRRPSRRLADATPLVFDHLDQTEPLRMLGQIATLRIGKKHCDRQQTILPYGSEQGLEKLDEARACQTFVHQHH
jgi:hypothetical protein